MDLTVNVAAAAPAASDVSRLLSARLPDPVLSGISLRADGDGLTLAGTDRERTCVLHRPALVHTDGAVLVPARPFADTLRALDTDEVRLVVEGNRLAVRTPSARFALPLLELDLHPGVAQPPPLVGRVDGRLFSGLVQTVASASTKDDALPMFTGVRVRAEGDRLRLVATDRFRLAIATLPCSGVDPELDVLVPARLLAEVARQAASAAEVALHADADRVALSWPGATLGTKLLATPFIDERRYISFTGEAACQVPAGALAAAVRRCGLFADERGAVVLELADGEVRVRDGNAGDRVAAGEAEESVKASTDGRLTVCFRSSYLLDGLRAFGERDVRLELQSGMRATAITAVDTGADSDSGADGGELRYVVMPLQQR